MNFLRAIRSRMPLRSISSAINSAIDAVAQKTVLCISSSNWQCISALRLCHYLIMARRFPPIPFQKILSETQPILLNPSSRTSLAFATLPVHTCALRHSCNPRPKSGLSYLEGSYEARHSTKQGYHSPQIKACCQH
jgi:hypothetical protein